MKRIAAVFGLVAAVSAGTACAQDSSMSTTVSNDPAMLEAARTITEDDYFRRISVIAHDSMGGRDTPSPGLEATAAWIAEEFRAMGLRPGGDDGSFLQRYAIETIRADLSSSAIEVDGGGVLRFGSDVLPAGRGSVEGDFTGGVVVATGASGDIDGMAASIQGRHVVYVAPAGDARAAFTVARALRTVGALSVMTVSDVSDSQWGQLRGRAESATSVRVGFGGGASPTLAVRSESMRRLLEANGATLPAAGSGALSLQEVEGLQLTLSPRIEVVQSQSAPNVVGILEGSDPVLKDEYIVYSAHMDHVGMRQPDASGDSIWNGADDDASGTTGIIEIAEAFASMDTAPRRSMIFLLVSGEEKGLWGSDYFAQNPGVPAESMVANLNADMIGRNWSDTIVVIGKEHSDLGTTMNAVNAAHPELDMTAIDDIWPEERFYFRSDHFNFARRGVPVLFFFNGTHDDYHGRDDEVDKIDTDKATRITKLMFYLGWEISERDERPQWNPESRAQIVTDG